MKEPTIALFVMRDNRWRFENEWPIARTKYTEFYFTPEGDLTTNKGKVISQAKKANTRNLSYDYKPWVGVAAGPQTPFLDFNYTDFLVQDDQSVDDALSLTFTSDVLTENLEVTGMPEVLFYASSNVSNTNWVVKLNEVQPDGTSVMITQGWLNSSSRESNVNPRLVEDWKELAVPDLESAPEDGAQFLALPAGAGKAKSYADWNKEFGGWLFRTRKVELFRSASTKEVSEARRVGAGLSRAPTAERPRTAG